MIPINKPLETGRVTAGLPARAADPPLYGPPRARRFPGPAAGSRRARGLPAGRVSKAFRAIARNALAACLLIIQAIYIFNVLSF